MSGDDLSNTGQMIKSYVHRAERLEEEIKGLNEDKAQIFAEAKSNGFDPKVLKRLLAYRRKNRKEAEEEDAIFETYLAALESAESAPPSRARARKPDGTTTMTMSYTDPETGEVTTTPPISMVDLELATRGLERKKPKPKPAPPAADIPDDPFGG
jgi:uncharacterized protein (UPF0335 family)